jgi:hypothetical protein
MAEQTRYLSLLFQLRQQDANNGGAGPAEASAQRGSCQSTCEGGKAQTERTLICLII